MVATVQSPLAKTERNQEIVRRIIEGRGEVTLQDLATEYGLTRSRIQRIVGDAGISMRGLRRAHKRPVRVTCGQCGQPYEKGTYGDHCRRAGHRRLTPPGEKVERNQKIVSLYLDGGYNTPEIAGYFDIPQPVVTRILHRSGVRATTRRSRKGGLPARGGLLNGHA